MNINVVLFEEYTTFNNIWEKKLEFFMNYKHKLGVQWTLCSTVKVNFNCYC